MVIGSSGGSLVATPDCKLQSWVQIQQSPQPTVDCQSLDGLPSGMALCCRLSSERRQRSIYKKHQKQLRKKKIWKRYNWNHWKNLATLSPQKLTNQKLWWTVKTVALAPYVLQHLISQIIHLSDMLSISTYTVSRAKWNSCIGRPQQECNGRIQPPTGCGPASRLTSGGQVTFEK